ncbi:MAG: HAMP domain-containing histidine kinase [Clostridia bacterium]|nr:HAMP domain-containing histidine kinase [Clostridia bacterium]
MLKGKSLRFRINLWYSVLIGFLSVLLIVLISVMGKNVQHAEAQQNLIRNVERNIDEIEAENGLLDIESDFAFNNDGVNVVVFSAAGEIIGGSYPQGAETDEPLENGRTTTVTIDGKDYFIYDSMIEFSKYEYKINGENGEVFSSESEAIDNFTAFEGDLDEVGEDCEISYRQAYEIALEHSGISEDVTTLIMARVYEYYDVPMYELEFYSSQKAYDDIWVRGIMKADNEDRIWDTITVLALLLLPAFIALGAIFGDRIAKNSLAPLKQLNETVSKTQSGDDLTRRVTTVDSDPDINSLADNFNKMFSRLQASFEAQRHFTSDASHELRTPVAVVLAESEYQLSEEGHSEEVRESFETIYKQADSMQKLISQLLNFTRMEQGSLQPDLVKENLSELVESVSDNIGRVHEKKVTLIKDITPDIMLNMDVELIARLCDNLISNAVRYGKEGGYVKVSLKKEKEKIILSVEDNGIGISKENLEKIWLRFFRVDKARSREEGCSGLGLPMVRQIALLHGAEVFAQSEENKGSVFTVIFNENSEKN